MTVKLANGQTRQLDDVDSQLTLKQLQHEQGLIDDVVDAQFAGQCFVHQESAFRRSPAHRQRPGVWRLRLQHLRRMGSFEARAFIVETAHVKAACTYHDDHQPVSPNTVPPPPIVTRAVCGHGGPRVQPHSLNRPSTCVLCHWQRGWWRGTLTEEEKNSYNELMQDMKQREQTVKRRLHSFDKVLMRG